MEKLLRALDEMEGCFAQLRYSLEVRDWGQFGGWLDLLQMKVAGFRANAKALEFKERESDGNEATRDDRHG